MQYKHLFFDLDHTLWDFEANSRQTLQELYLSLQLDERGVTDFDGFHRQYIVHNDKLWERYRNGFIKVDELRWKRMWLTLLDFKIADEPLARKFTKPEVMIRVKCNIHSWMHAFIGVLDHPYYAVSGDTGSFTIANLPPGDYTLEAWHEKLGAQEQKITVSPSGKITADFTFKGE